LSNQHAMHHSKERGKAYGATGRIAGAEIAKGDQVLFFDDVISEGLSKLEAIKPLEALGAKVENILVVVDREQHGKENLGKLGTKSMPWRESQNSHKGFFKTER